MLLQYISIAFAGPVAVVDGNVYRVLARFFGIEIPIDSTQGKKIFKAIAQDNLPKNAPAAYNQGIMVLWSNAMYSNFT